MAKESDLRRSTGPTRRHIRNVALPEAPRGRSDRSTTPQGHITDVTFGTKRQNESSYSTSEKILLENTTKVRMLVEELEKKEAEKNET